MKHELLGEVSCASGRVRPGGCDVDLPLGDVMVDWAKLAFVDADALGLWEHNDTLNGLADFVYWGRDAEQVAPLNGLSPFRNPTSTPTRNLVGGKGFSWNRAR